jgi:hypothetical protein
MVLLTLLLLLLQLAAPARAQSPPAVPEAAAPAAVEQPAALNVQVRTSLAEIDFPNEIRFLLEATANRRIERITLLWRVGDEPVLSYRYAQFAPGTAVRATYTWRVRDVLLPGVTISYFWELEDADENVVRTPQQEILYEDRRFNWRSRSIDRVTVYWYSGDTVVGPELLAQAVPILEQLSQEFQVRLEKPVKIYAYARLEDFHSAVGSRPQPGLVGLAAGTDRVYVYAPPTRQGLTQAVDYLRHELAHLIVGQLTANPYADPPRWLNEGLASYLMRNDEELRQLEAALAQALRQNRLISLRSLASQFPSDDTGIALAYAQSYSVVKYIIETYGGQKFGELLRAFKEGTLPDDALRKVLNVDTEKLEQDWHQYLRRVAREGGRQSAPGQAGQAPRQPAGGEEGFLQRSISFWSGFFQRYGVIVAAVAGGLVGLLILSSIVYTLWHRFHPPGGGAT